MLSKKEARALRKKLTSRPLKDVGKLATSNASNFTPLGKLSILPRELRDEIYSHVCSEGFSYDLGIGSGRKGSQIWRGLGLSMLQVSNAIREEFQAVLYSKGVFDIGYNSGSIQIKRRDIPFVNDILNIKITVILHPDCESQADGFWSNEEEEPLFEPEPVSHFTGTSIMRHTCVIELKTQGPTALKALLSSPVVNAMSQLTGFKTVQLKFSTTVDYWVQSWTFVVRESIYDYGTCLGFDTLVLQISSALEPALGAFTVTRGRECYMWWYQDVTFHPQNHPTEKLDKLGAEFSTRTGERTSAYPFLNRTKRYRPKWENHRSLSPNFLHKEGPINCSRYGGGRDSASLGQRSLDED